MTEPEHEQRFPRPSPDVVAKRVGGDVLLVQLQTNKIFSLKPTGARLWELLSEGRDRAEAEQAMLEQFDVQPDELRREIDDLLRELAEERLVVADD